MNCPLKPSKGYVVCVFPEGALKEWEEVPNNLDGQKTLYRRVGTLEVKAKEVMEKDKATERSEYVSKGKALEIVEVNSENYDFSVGDKALFGNFANSFPVYFENKEYIFVRDMHVLCTIK